MQAQTEISPPSEFASTMQQLVAEAEKNIGPRPTGASLPFVENGAGAQAGFAKLAERLSGLERLLSQVAEKVSVPALPEGGFDLAAQMQRMEEQMAGLCQTESVNHRLFNSLHQELKSYRDNFLRESLQKPFIRDLVMLYDDLSNLAGQMESAGPASAKKAGAISQWCANLQNAVDALLELLQRMDVNPVEAGEFVDRALHRVVSYEPAEFVEDDGRIVLRVKRGFIWRDQVLRPEEVVAKRFS
jgi:molecular chaperone GrpE (heat shock protein)